MNKSFTDVHFQDKVLQRVSAISVSSVKYELEDVFVVGHVHTEAIPIFFKIKYILNVDTCWVLCGKLLLPCTYECHFHAYQVAVHNDWILFNPGNELDFQALDTYLVDDRLFVSLRYSVWRDCKHIFHFVYIYDIYIFWLVEVEQNICVDSFLNTCHLCDPSKTLCSGV